MYRIISLDNFRKSVPEIIEQVKKGIVFIIQKHGKMVVVFKDFEIEKEEVQKRKTKLLKALIAYGSDKKRSKSPPQTNQELAEDYINNKND
jgi:hypothetical protein